MITTGFNFENTRFDAFVILSVDISTYDTVAQNARNGAFVLWMIETGVHYKTLQGCCFGPDKHTETSYLITQKAFDDFIIGSHWLEGQDSVLFLSEQEHHRHGQRNAVLAMLREDETAGVVFTGEYRALGKWTNVSKEKALASDYWTYDPWLHEYWIAVPDAREAKREARANALAAISPHLQCAFNPPYPDQDDDDVDGDIPEEQAMDAIDGKLDFPMDWEDNTSDY